MSKYRVTVDTGGTFSDFVFFNEDTGEITITKVPSTPKEPFQAVLNGVKELIDQGVPAGDISFFCHGTTVGTNALLEEKGAKTGLLVTQGFRGIYEVMEQTRGYGPATYDLFFEKPRLLAPPYLTEEIPERVDFRGNVLKPIDVETSREAVRRLKKKGVQSVAVCFLNIFRQRPAELFFEQARLRDVGVIVRVPLASGLLTGKFDRETSFASDDHRAFNRHGERFDMGETFAGVDFERGLEVVEELRALVPEGATLAQLALRWILGFEAVSTVIPGAKTPEQARANAAAADLPPLPEDSLQTIAAIYRERIAPQVHHRW